MKKLISYSDAIDEVLRENNNFATLQTIYREILKYRRLTGKTPFNTIQERVQRDKRFTKVDRGVYALTAYLDKLPKSIKPVNDPDLKKQRTHFVMQGMLLEIGNLLSYGTYCPNKNGIFAGKKLSELMILKDIPDFTFNKYVNLSKRIDVSWFGHVGLPVSFFEVDTTPSFQRSLLKFLELRYFHVSFYIVSDKVHKKVYEKEIKRDVYKYISNRCNFRSYEVVEKMYSATAQQNLAIKSFF